MHIINSVTELYMRVNDADLLRRVIKAKRLTARQLSRAMGWKSHSYMNRILNGEVRTVTPDVAVKLAYLLEVPVDLVFAPRVSGEIRQPDRKKSA